MYPGCCRDRRRCPGLLGVAKILAFFLDRYPDQSVCLFVGLIGGMLPSLFREAGEQGRSQGSWISMGVAFCVVLALLLGLNLLSVTILPSFGWYLFCGFCMALSIIAPGMSFSTLLMPLGLYTPLVDGIGSLDLGVLVPAGIGAVVTILCLAKAIDALFTRFYSAPSTPSSALSSRLPWSLSPLRALPPAWAAPWPT